MSLIPYCDSYEKKIFSLEKISYQDLELVELGNNTLSPTHPGWSPATPTSKLYYESLGVKHTSIDINGLDGSLPINLDHPIPENLIEQSQVLTNFGTLEHVNNQYMAFKNCHNLVKEKGLFIHAFPRTGHWDNHCRYRYECEFVENLSNLCGYRIIDLHIANTDSYSGRFNMIYAALQKNEKTFISENEFKQLKIDDCGDTTYTGNYGS